MSKGLEALKDLYNGNLTKEYKLQCYKDIETALKRLETLEEEKQSFDRQLEKKLKALEIIKSNKDMRTAVLSSCKKWNEYNLLKEVLL